jgi:hypothetical protein
MLFCSITSLRIKNIAASIGGGDDALLELYTCISESHKATLYSEFHSSLATGFTTSIEDPFDSLLSSTTAKTGTNCYYFTRTRDTQFISHLGSLHDLSRFGYSIHLPFLAG